MPKVASSGSPEMVPGAFAESPRVATERPSNNTLVMEGRGDLREPCRSRALAVIGGSRDSEHRHHRLGIQGPAHQVARHWLVMRENREHRTELENWADWAGDVAQAAIAPQGRDLVHWAIEVVRDFYSDQWFARHALMRSIPVMSLCDWPLSSPLALVSLIERAARIAIAPPQVRERLAEGPNGIRESRGDAPFRHMDVVLEVVGLALRDGCSVVAEAETAGGRYPDLRVTRGTMSYSIEVTRQGLDREYLRLDRQSSLLCQRLTAIELAQRVESVVRVARELADEELSGFLTDVARASASTAADGTSRTVDLGYASATIYPRGRRPAQAAIFEGPLLGGDMWPRFARRLREKAARTSGAGRTWLRIDEVGGLFRLTPAGQMPLDQQLALVSANIRSELDDFPHICGVVLGHGAEQDWYPNRPQPTIDDASGAVALERRLPGGRRRRTFAVPVGTHSRIVVPDHVALRPANWYGSEPGWLTWALNLLEKPSVTRLVTGEAARALIP